MKSNKGCPVCGGKTVVEVDANTFESRRIRRCTNLVSRDIQRPLEVCGWSVEIYLNGNPI